MTPRPPPGSPHPVAALYALHGARLRHVLRAKVLREQRRGATSARLSLIDDLIQDVFTRLLASGAPCTEARDPLAYLVAIARNLYIDRLRRERRDALLASAERSAAGGTSGAPHGSPDDTDCNSSSLGDEAAMTAYLGRLPSDLSLTYEARFVRGLSQRDAAALLGVSRWQVREREERLLAGARRLLAGSSKKVPPNSDG